MTIEYIRTLESHPSLPFFALGDSHGAIHLLSAYQSTEIKLITTFYLSNYSIQKIVFGINGRYLIAMDEFNDLFIIKVRKIFLFYALSFKFYPSLSVIRK